MRIGILGGGLSGISLQRFLRHDSEVLEKEDVPGGLCRTFNKDGFYYDIGGHILFSKDKKITDFVKKVLGGNVNYCRRNNKILFKGRYVKYPFENGLGSLARQDNYECLIDYLGNEYPRPVNFKEWIYYIFGKSIAEKYLIPYNRKVWKTPLEEMSFDWAKRIPKPPVEDILKSALGIETEGHLHQLYFHYPRKGGIAAFIKALIKERASIIPGFEVKKIRKEKRTWVVSDGKEEKKYDKLVLTIPLKEALRCFDKAPTPVLNAARALRHNSVRVVLVGVNNKSLFDKSAIYLADKNILAHRICYMGYFSKNMVPGGCSSLIAEITTYRRQPLYNASDSELIEKVIKDLSKAGIINRRDIVTTDVKNIEYAYVVHDLNRQKNAKIIKDFFASLDIELLGRFAEFEYINMDEAIKKSMKMAKKLNRA
jgi:protoporphyrinogen oxidase